MDLGSRIGGISVALCMGVTGGTAEVAQFRMVESKSEEVPLLNVHIGFGAEISAGDHLDLGHTFPYHIRGEINHPRGTIHAALLNQFFSALEFDDFDNSPENSSSYEMGLELYLWMRETRDHTRVNIPAGRYIVAPSVQREMLVLRAGYFDRTRSTIVGKRRDGIEDYCYAGKLESRGYYLGLGHKMNERTLYDVKSRLWSGRSSQARILNYGLDLLFGEPDVIGDAPDIYRPVEVKTSDWGARLWVGRLDYDYDANKSYLWTGVELGKRPGFANDWYGNITVGMGFSGGSMRLR